MTEDPQTQVLSALDASKLSWEAGDIAVSAEIFDALGNGAIKWIGELEKVDIAPGDIAVLMLPYKLRATERFRVIEMWDNIWRDLLPGVKVMVLDEGMKIGVLHMPKDA